MSFKNTRENAGLTQDKASEMLGVTKTSISQWENGVTMPSAKRLPMIAKIYGCTVDDLLRSD